MKKLEIYIEREDKNVSIELESNITVKGLLEKLRINPVTVIVSKNGEVCTEQEKLAPKDKIKIISVVSGG